MSLSWSTYKIGVDEIPHLKTIMKAALTPIKEALEWRLGEVGVDDSEYKHRDGFIPHSENLGGPEIRVLLTIVR